ncbi:MAG: eukaryotic-like serine/threonine-protein kinase [Acidobacteriota bacterium]|jgi:serine/threonine-protein kinase|nr:eukaryotic-like serine/threonine-protein kinase [Acidobacteriota bacterium]
MVGRTLLNYRITEKLGAGGQGTVYKAVDERLGRTVVIKILSPELTAREVNLKRFQREAQLASSLDHPNICTIYGLHEAEGLHFIAMQYIEGKNVRQLVNGRPLSLESALSIAYQVADALTAAHSKGIIHRDIKAGNVMVTSSGLAKVLDFGLAKLLDDDGRKGTDVHLTELGVPYGTATYAAPEQASGKKVDHRADIFSTGVLLYEMLAGIWPFKGQTTVEVRYAVLHDTPDPIEEVRKDEPPPSIQRILDRSLAKRPEERYPLASEMRDDLRAAMREVASARGDLDPQASGVPSEVVAFARPPRHEPGTGGGFGGGLRRWWRGLTGSEKQATSLPPGRRGGSTQTSGGATSVSGAPQAQQHVSQFELEKSIAILPFRNIANDPEVGFYEFSLADAVITELARNRQLIVRPSSMIVKYQGKDVDPREVGQELNVSAVLSANFLRAGGTLRVNAQLVDVITGDMLWSDRIDATAEDLIALQDMIAHRISEGLKIEPHLSQSAPAAPATTNAQAYEEYLRGRAAFAKFLFHTLDPEDCDEAVEHFQHAVRLDHTFALAHSGLGACFANKVLKGLGGAEDYELAENAFSRALDLDPNLIEARILMVFIYLARGEKRKARAEVARLARQAPNEPAVYFVKGALHRLDGEYDRALRAFGKLARLDPAARVVASYNRARVFMYQHRHEDALLELEQGARVEPHHPLIRTFQAVVMGRSGNVDEAVRVLREVLEEHPTMDGIRPLLAQQLIRQGDAEAARAQLTERVREAADADHDIAYWLGTAHAMLGERDEALHWLDRAIDLGNENRTWFESDPNWEALREDPRFVALMRRIEAAQIQSQPREISQTEAADGGSSTHPEAYEEYLKGRDASGRFIYHTLARVDSEEAVVNFKRAVQLDPNFALAWAALGGAYANRVIKVIGGPEDYERAAEALERALALKPGLLEARLHMVFVEMGRGNKARARELAAQLVTEYPTDVGAQFAYATVARLDGRYQDALDAYGRMLKINPAERVVVSYNRARVFLYQHRHDDAEAELNLGAQMEPNHPFIKSFKAIISAYRGDLEGSMRTMAEVLRRNPDMDGVRPLYAQFLIQWGDLDGARVQLTEGTLRVARANFDVAYWVASAYAMLGDADPAFEWLGRAIDVGNENRRWFESDPHWASLHENPRFGELMNRIGNPEARANEARQQ